MSIVPQTLIHCRKHRHGTLIRCQLAWLVRSVPVQGAPFFPKVHQQHPLWPFALASPLWFSYCHCYTFLRRNSNIRVKHSYTRCKTSKVYLQTKNTRELLPKMHSPCVLDSSPQKVYEHSPLQCYSCPWMPAQWNNFWTWELSFVTCGLPCRLRFHME